MGNGPERGKPSRSVLVDPWFLSDLLEIAYEVLRTLATSKIALIVDRLTPLLHMDPVAKLPPEITYQIFSYLDASTLLTSSLASKSWRARIMDTRLWKQKYYEQGWRINTGELQAFEEEGNRARIDWPLKGRAKPVPQLQKKRAVPSLFNQSQNDIASDTSQWREQHGTIEADTDMTDVNDVPTTPPRQTGGVQDDMLSPSQTPGNVLGSPNPPVRPTMTHKDTSGAKKLNWACVYKQRRRLEENWQQGHFTNFQLPHPDYPQEAHRECVYTIQFVGKWLISGSRDKTMRVWDLETRRLRGQPLTGHSQSVLCLQFDPSEKEDVIISGSSDTSVIIWRFSTGQKIKEIPHAHRDSVLNLRFDHRYLVTCSKDRLIKIWNRNELSPLDANYPKVKPSSQAKVASYIIDVSTMLPSEIEDKLLKRQLKVLQPYTLLMALDGHVAAVNAIQISKDEIVSASGDRTIKVWNVINGDLVSTLSAHQKGIACVQFDSKRIVSGSSDHTVRIFDHASQSLVGELAGHDDLVRSVQADFGDAPFSDSQLADEVRQAEADYERAVAAGEIEHETTGSMQSSRNRRDHKHDIGVLGATLPPGGGGSKWGRIVSGSYDQTIIIWRKGPDGKWVRGQTLRQEDAVRAAAVADHRAYEGQIAAAASAAQPSASQIAHAAATLQSLSTVSQQAIAAAGALQTATVQSITAQTIQESPSGLTVGSGAPPTAGNAISQQSAAQAAYQYLLQTGSLTPATLAAHAQAAQTAAPHPTQVQHQPQNTHAPTSRVFKLQFDARRIICCSQDSRIVGWDFAAGDADIIEASPFFIAS